MKKIVVLFAFICAFGAFVTRPSAEVRHAALETLSPLAMMQAAQSLPIEAYEAI